MTERTAGHELRRNTRPWAMVLFAALAGASVLSVWGMCVYYGWWALSASGWLSATAAVIVASLLYAWRTSRAVIARIEIGDLVLFPELGAELRIPLDGDEMEHLWRTRALSPNVLAGKSPFQRTALGDVCLWLFQETPQATLFREHLARAMGTRSSAERR